MTCEAPMSQPPRSAPREIPLQEVDDVAIRFAGDSGDGMQLTGTQFTHTAALLGNDLATFPDYPAEIRAPAGTTFGVSGFQVRLSSHDIHTPGDQPDVLVAMNPAALQVNLAELRDGGMLIVNTGAFDANNLKKAGYAANPLEDPDLADRYKLVAVDLEEATLRALEGLGLSNKEALRCKNMVALGMLYYAYSRQLTTSERWLEQKFAKKPQLLEANLRALRAGHAIAENQELFTVKYQVARAVLPPGTYRNIMGNQALAMGLVAASKLAGLRLFYGSYPITPASDILHNLSRYKNYGVITFQAEDEIAAATSALGAAYGGALGVTGTSGPGLALKTETIGLAVMTELPMVIVDVQRGGPSTGLPTKTEQADLLQAVFGRNSEAPLPVVAAATPSDCFFAAIEAARIALTYMTPVILLSDGYIANGAEPFRVPEASTLTRIPVRHPSASPDFRPYVRDPVTLARPWAIPGTAGLEHRIGGIEKADVTGHISYDPINHEKMVGLREAKVMGVADSYPPTETFGDVDAQLCILGWGSTYGPVRGAVLRARAEGLKVAQIHLRNVWPLPKDLGAALKPFRKVLIPEMNRGHLWRLVRSELLIDAVRLPKVQGRPFTAGELLKRIREELA
jgi:2-oxoglutarate ferredoxin oxidoreductase subunit alpha